MQIATIGQRWHFKSGAIIALAGIAWGEHADCGGRQVTPHNNDALRYPQAQGNLSDHSQPKDIA
jgi:hypothetical protein